MLCWSMPQQFWQVYKQVIFIFTVLLIFYLTWLLLFSYPMEIGKKLMQIYLCKLFLVSSEMTNWLLRKKYKTNVKKTTHLIQLHISTFQEYFKSKIICVRDILARLAKVSLSRIFSASICHRVVLKIQMWVRLGLDK